MLGRKPHVPQRGAPIKAYEYRRLADAVHQLDSALPPHGYGIGIQTVQTTGGMSVRNDQYFPFWAKITAVAVAAATSLSGSLSDSALSLTVSSATGFPATGTGNYWIKIDDEVIEVTAGHGTTTWTVTRGMVGTTAVAHASGARVDWAYRPYSWIEEQQDTPAGFVAHSVPRSGTGTAASRDIPAYEVNGNVEVPVGTFVQMWLGYDGDYYLFKFSSSLLTVRDTRHCTTLTAAVTGAGTTLAVSGYGSFPLSGSYTVQVEDELMTVTAGQGTNSWTVTRGASSTVAVAHHEGAFVCQPGGIASTLNGGINSSVTSLTVAGLSNFPTSGRFYIKIDSEVILVTAGAGTLTWTIERAKQNTTAASHSNGATVARWAPIVGVKKVTFHDQGFTQPGDPSPDEAIHYEVNQIVEIVSGPDGVTGLYDGYKLRRNPHTGTLERDVAIWIQDVNG